VKTDRFTFNQGRFKCLKTQTVKRWCTVQHHWMLTRGREIICKPLDTTVSTTGGKRKIGNADTYGNMPVRILITPKPLSVAVKDMEKVIEKGRVKMDVDERAGRYRNISVEHEETKKLMWKGLVAICSNAEKKQKPDDDVDNDDGGVDLDDLMSKLIG
jgi:hypothetical protein